MRYEDDNRKVDFITVQEDATKATVWTHFKGNKYQIYTIARDSETLEDVVVYQNDEHEVFTRKAAMFFSFVDKEKYPHVKQRYRFEASK